MMFSVIVTPQLRSIWATRSLTSFGRTESKSNEDKLPLAASLIDFFVIFMACPFFNDLDICISLICITNHSSGLELAPRQTVRIGRAAELGRYLIVVAGIKTSPFFNPLSQIDWAI